MKSETRILTIPNTTPSEIAEELELEIIFSYYMNTEDISRYIRHITRIVKPALAYKIKEALEKMFDKIIMELQRVREDIDGIKRKNIDLDKKVHVARLLKREQELERLLINGRIRVTHSEKGNTQVITITLEYDRDPETTVVLMGDENEVETIIEMLEEIKDRNTSKRRIHYYTGYSGFNRLYDLYRYLRL